MRYKIDGRHRLIRVAFIILLTLALAAESTHVFAWLSTPTVTTSTVESSRDDPAIRLLQWLGQTISQLNYQINRALIRSGAIPCLTTIAPGAAALQAGGIGGSIQATPGLVTVTPVVTPLPGVVTSAPSCSNACEALIGKLEIQKNTLVNLCNQKRAKEGDATALIGAGIGLISAGAAVMAIGNSLLWLPWIGIPLLIIGGALIGIGIGLVIAAAVGFVEAGQLGRKLEEEKLVYERIVRSIMNTCPRACWPELTMPSC